MKKNTIFFLLCLALQPVYAQERQTQYEIIASLNIGYLSGETLAFAGSFITSSGIKLGFGLEHQLSSNFSINTQILFIQKGSASSFVRPIPGSQLLLSPNGPTRIGFLQAPLLGTYYFGKTGNLYTTFGPFISSMIFNPHRRLENRDPSLFKTK